MLVQEVTPLLLPQFAHITFHLDFEMGLLLCTILAIISTMSKESLGLEDGDD